MQQIKLLTKIVLALFFLTGLSNLQAQIFYVDQNHTNASDDNPGTEALPWETLLKATQTVVAGNTVYVKTGVYIDTVNTFSTKFRLTNSGTAANPITFISTPQLAAIIRSASLPSSTNDYAWALGSGNQYITIDGFTIEGGLISYGDYNVIKNSELTHGRVPDTDPSLNWGITLYNASYSTVENNYVHSMIDSGNNGHNTASIMVFLDSDYNLIQKNTADAGNGIIYSAFGQKGGQMNNNIWRYNLALNATAGFLGMASTNGLFATEDNTYYQNISVNCTTAFKLNHMANRFIIYNNTAVNCDSFLTASQNTNIDTELWNNIQVGTSYRAIFWSGYPDALPFSSLLAYSDYNCFYNNNVYAFREKTPRIYYNTLSDWQNGTGSGMNSIVDDPLLIGSDYRLQSSSPCINAGIDRQDYDSDLNTTESIDMGAYITGGEIIGHNWGTQTSDLIFSNDFE